MQNEHFRNGRQSGLLLHVGLTKTGTTTLQESLFAHHPQVFYLGKAKGLPQREGCVTETAYEILKPVLWQLSQPFDCVYPRNLYTKKVLPEIAPDMALVASWESLGNQMTIKFVERLKRVLLVFGACRVLFVLRHPLTHVPSEYLQNLKGHFLRQNRSWMGSAPFITIEEWFARLGRKNCGAHDLFSYNENIRASVNLLGRENVGVLLFEELLADPDNYYRSLCSFVGIEVEEGVRLSRRQHFNRSLTQAQLNRIKKLNASLWHRFFCKGKSFAGRQSLLGSRAGKPGDKPERAKIELTPEIEAEIVAMTRSGHQWLSENLSLPLAKYNYPL